MKYTIKTNTKNICEVTLCEAVRAVKRASETLLYGFDIDLEILLNRISEPSLVKGFCERRGRTIYVQVNIYDQLKDGYLSVYRKSPARRRFIKDVVKTLLHELKHVEQIASGKIDMEGEPRWFTSDGDEPWEVDADNYMKLADEYLDSSHFDGESSIEADLPDGVSIKYLDERMPEKERRDLITITESALSRHPELVAALSRIHLTIETRVPSEGIYPLVDMKSGVWHIYIPLDPMYFRVNIARRLLTGLINAGLRAALLDSDLPDEDKNRLSIDHLPCLIINSRKIS